MSTITAPPARSVARDHPVSWRQLARVTWLLHRSALIGLLALYIGCAIAIVLGEHGTHSNYASYVANGCVANPIHFPCGTISNTFAKTTDPFSAAVIALSVLPVIVGIFIGAPLLSRELESGTFRFTWTQAVGRTRFVLTTLVMLAAFVTAAAVVLGLLLSTWAHPFEVVRVESRWQSGLFGTTWFMAATWTLFALALGAFLGVAVKRTVAAMAATTAGVGGLILASFVVVVRHLLAIAPLTTTKNSPVGVGLGALNQPAFPGNGDESPGSWLVRSWFTGPNGNSLGTVAANKVRDSLYAGGDGIKSVDPASWLSRHHDTFWVSYQPESRFWIFQGLEGVILIGLAALLTVVTVRFVRRRT